MSRIDTASAGIAALSNAIIFSKGWRRSLIAFGSGAIAALALSPLGLVPAFFFSFPVAIWLLDGAAPEAPAFSRHALVSAAKDGWWFGFGYFLAGLWWIGAAFLVETDEFIWAMPLGVIGLPAVLAIFMALSFCIARLFWRPGPGRIFALVLGIGISEWLRHFLFTGFPWNTFGQGFASSVVLAQGASIVGTEGLSLLVVAIFAAPATLADRTTGFARWRPVTLAALAFMSIATFGYARLWHEGGVSPGVRVEAMVPGVRVRLVQPNTSQRDKILQRDSLATLAKFIELSNRATGPGLAGMEDVTHLVWPESPFPTILSRDFPTLGEIARLIPSGTTLITGAVRMEETPAGFRRFFNTLHVIGPRAEILTSYDKQHLVPFGEYLPLEGLLSSFGLRRFVHAPGAFAAGESRPLLAIPGLPPVLPLICYEAIFPHEIKGSGPRPGLILNITNDAWFGETSGPHQHFAQSRMRAIEFGLPLIRVANTGISATVDPYGRVLASMMIGIAGIADVGLPRSLDATVYSVYSVEIRLFGCLIALMLAIGLGPLKTVFDRRRRLELLK